MAKTNFKIGIIYQCYIYFPNWNVIIYVIHKSMFVTVKSFLMLIIMTYIIHKSVFCNSQGLVNLIFDSFLVQLETWFNTQCWTFRTSITKKPLWTMICCLTTHATIPAFVTRILFLVTVFLWKLLQVVEVGGELKELCKLWDIISPSRYFTIARRKCSRLNLLFPIFVLSQYALKTKIST